MSGKICAVVNCHSSYRFLKLWTKTKCLEHVEQLHEDCPCLQPFSFRRFPKNTDLRKEWLRAINRKDFLPTDNSVVCSKHFIDGSRIPQVEMGYERKVVVGHHHFLKQPPPLHKKRKMHSAWNINRHKEKFPMKDKISLRTLDRLHTIMQLKKEEVEESSYSLTSDVEATAIVDKPETQIYDSQQGPSWFGGSLVVVHPSTGCQSLQTVKTELPDSLFEDPPQFPIQDNSVEQAIEIKLDPLEMDIPNSLLHGLPDFPPHSPMQHTILDEYIDHPFSVGSPTCVLPSLDKTSILDPLFDDSSQCSFYNSSVEISYNSLDLELQDSLLIDSLDLHLSPKETFKTDPLNGYRQDEPNLSFHLSTFDQTMYIPPSSMNIEMSETLQVGLRHIHTPSNLQEAIDQPLSNPGEPFDSSLRGPWFEDLETLETPVKRSVLCDEPEEEPSFWEHLAANRQAELSAQQRDTQNVAGSESETVSTLLEPEVSNTFAEQPSTSNWLPFQDNCCDPLGEQPSGNNSPSVVSISKPDIHSRVSSHKCETCGREYDRSRDFKSHLLTHKVNQRYVCESCDKSYTIEANLKRHRVVNHTKENVAIEFKKVAKESKSQHGFVQHLVSHKISVNGRYVCDVCKSNFSHKAQLETHSVIHLDVKSLNCKICGERFQCSDSFRSHLLKHMADSDKSYVL